MQTTAVKQRGDSDTLGISGTRLESAPAVHNLGCAVVAYNTCNSFRQRDWLLRQDWGLTNPISLALGVLDLIDDSAVETPETISTCMQRLADLYTSLRRQMGDLILAVK